LGGGGAYTLSLTSDIGKGPSFWLVLVSLQMDEECKLLEGPDGSRQNGGR